MATGGRTWCARGITALAVASTLSLPLSATPAHATPVPPASIHISTRDTLAIASWTGADAVHYTVERATTADFADADETTASSEVALLTPLQPDTTYYVRVTAVGPDGTQSVPGPVVSFTTEPRRFPLAAPVLTVVSPGPTSLEARWTAPAEGLRYEVQLGKDPSFTRPVPTSRLSDASTVTFSDLDNGTRYFLRARVVDAAGLPQSDWSAQVTRKPAAQPLRVGSFNVLKWRDANWSRRRTAVAETILGEKLDVVGLQEATPSRMKSGTRQYQDIANLLGADWALTDASTGAPGEARTVYNRTTLDLVDHGYEALAGSRRFGVQRYATWAIFEQRISHKRFIFVNTHFAVYSARVRKHHKAAAAQLVSMVKRVNTAGLPVVIAGDFNTGQYRNSSNAVYRTITGAGYVDPLVRTGKPGAAEKLIHADLKTYNGYTRRAPRDRWARMIDQIFVSRMRVSEWETVAKLNGAGRWVGPIPSDHNLIRASVYLP